MKKEESLARKQCANYSGGKCLGVMFTRIEGKVTFKLDSRFANKECSAKLDKCMYFNNIVIGSVANATR
tara:strand:- start:355 stop:561 length:207 start_codon:yes stop_codon:yes gene_type:complete